MKDRKLIFFLYVAGIISAAELFVILTTVKPSEAGRDVITVLFGCIFILLTVIAGMLWHRIKSGLYRSSSLSRWVTLRQAALFGAVVTLALLFKSLSILTVWDITPLAVSAILIEFFFQADKSSPEHGLT